jgi:adenylate cyclase
MTQAAPRPASPARPARADLDLDGLREWLVDRGLQGAPIEDQLQGFCDRLVASGFPLRRFNLSIGTLHPQHGARNYTWRGKRIRIDEYPRQLTGEQNEVYLRSPIHHLRTSSQTRLRRRLTSADALDFPVLEDLHRSGLTDYAAQLVRSGNELADPGAFNAVVRDEGTDPLAQSTFFSFATDEVAGFDDEALDQVAGMLPYLALAVRARSSIDIARTVVQVYLGEDAGRRVLTGEIDRHSVQRIEAVIWLCDLRGFSTVGSRVSSEELVEILNAHLEMMARPVIDNGGQILKFMGDGFLATFDLSRRDPQVVCLGAVNAAERVLETFPAFRSSRRAAGQQTLDFGIALHQGEVLYGNVGTSERLDFTVVGSAVNEASRIEGLCRPLRRKVLVSSRLHETAGLCHERMISMGVHALRSIREPQELFTIVEPEA